MPNRKKVFISALIFLLLSLHLVAENVVCIGKNGLVEGVFFPFDSACIPWRHGLQLALVRAQREGEPVLSMGKKGTPDSGKISYYGSVVRVDDEFHMWYLGHPQENPDRIRLCYAVSKDGKNWQKPSLGLVEYKGTRQNNLVALEVPGDIMSCNVIYEPQDPDPSRRFKIFYEVRPEYRGHVAFSPDGLRWTPSSMNPVTHIRIEPSGLVKHRGCYYVCGQNANIDRGFQKRVLITLASYDFEHWTEAACLGFRRDPVPPRPFYTPYNAGPQVHLGAALWHRGNVILGFYGMWNMPTDDMDRRRLRMDIGLVVTHDALQYFEPLPDFKMLDAFEEGWSHENPEGELAALSQGQGFENVGDKTYMWYGVWGPANRGVRLATWEKDRLGYFYPSREPIEGQRWVQEVMPHFVTCPIKTDGESVRMFINVAGVDGDTKITCELLDEHFRAIPGFSNSDAALIQENGFRVPLLWKADSRELDLSAPIRIRVNFGGIRPEDARIYALYVASESTDRGSVKP